MRGIDGKYAVRPGLDQGPPTIHFPSDRKIKFNPTLAGTLRLHFRHNTSSSDLISSVAAIPIDRGRASKAASNPIITKDRQGNPTTDRNVTGLLGPRSNGIDRGPLIGQLPRDIDG